MYILGFILLIILLSIYIGQVIWIYKDTRKRQEELAVFWCILALFSFPIVLIIYIILTRSNKENYTCSSCGFKLKSNWKFCPNCNAELKNNLRNEKYINIKRPIGVVPIAIFIVAVVLFGTFLTFSLLNIKNSFTKVTVPGTTTINLKNKGEYAIFYEYNNDSEALVNYSELKDMDITLINLKSKNKVLISKSSIQSNYSFGGTKGSAFLKFKVEEAGNYELSTSSKVNNNGKITISIIQGFINKIIFTVLGSFVIMFGAILSCTFVIIRGRGYCQP